MSLRCVHTRKKIEGNGNKAQCQCTMCHECMKDKTIFQCMLSRDPESNRFCAKCESAHGAAYRAKYGGTV